MDDIKNVSNCISFMKLYLSLIDELKQKGLDPAIAADEANKFIANWFMYNVTQEPTMTELGFTADAGDTDED